MPSRLHVPLFIAFGESNSGGYVPNADASAPELAARPEVQMFNVDTLVFEDLDIGTNNNLDHAALNSTTHGIELELANAVADGRFNESVVYYIQTGQGGDTIDTWAIAHASGYWTKFVARLTAAQAILPDVVPVVFYSQGINDSIDFSASGLGTGYTTDTAGWKTATIAMLAQIRAEIESLWPGRGDDALIVMTKFKDGNGNFSDYNSRMGEIALADANTVTIQTPSTGIEWQVDNNHWTYLGMKNLSELFIDEVLASGGQSAAPVISPATGDFAVSQTVTITGPGTIKYTDDTSDPHIGTVYSGSFASGTPDVTIRARSIEQGKKSGSNIAVYTGPPAAVAWDAADAAAGGLTLTNTDLDLTSSVGAWKSARLTQVIGTGDKIYVEFKCTIGSGDGFYMIGLAGIGADVSTYFGDSTNSIGLAVGTQYLNGFTAGTGASATGSGPITNDLYGLAVDDTAGKLWISKNGTWLGSGADPATGANPAATFTPGDVNPLYPGMSMYGAPSGPGTWRLQAASADQTYSPPSGFSSLG